MLYANCETMPEMAKRLARMLGNAGFSVTVYGGTYVSAERERDGIYGACQSLAALFMRHGRDCDVCCVQEGPILEGKTGFVSKRGMRIVNVAMLYRDIVESLMASFPAGCESAANIKLYEFLDEIEDGMRCRGKAWDEQAAVAV